MADNRKCERCGATLGAYAQAGLCPACLLRGGLSPSLDGAPEPAAGPKAQATNPAGRKIQYLGDYELLREIARGGMGVVYQARQVSLNRTVAVKMILGGQLASVADVQRFRAEAEAAAKLQHPGIVAIHEVGEHEGQPYFSMDYIEGQSLADVLREGPLPAKRAATYLKDIAEAIHYAHQRGVLHRDLKPSNVLIDQFDAPRVTDFGLAKRLQDKSDSKSPASEFPDSLTLTGQVLGTPNYMPPEQARGGGKGAGPTADIYSLGAILYQMLSGQPPFVAATPLETMRRVLEEEPVPPNQILRSSRRKEAHSKKSEIRNPKSEIDHDLETICLKCLEKAPARRYPTALELVEDLGRFQKGEPILARPCGPIERTGKWIRRKPVPAAFCGLVLLLAAIGAASWGNDAWKRHQQRVVTEQKAAAIVADWRACQENLRRLHTAFDTFLRASNRPPDSIDELVPAFVPDDSILLRCPLARRGGVLAYSLRPGNATNSSYLYEFGPEPVSSSRIREDLVPLGKRGQSLRELRQAELKHYGSLVPQFRCAHHFPVLNISFGGELFESFALWNPEVNARANPDGHLPPFWTIQGGLPGASEAAVDTNEVHSGKASAQITSLSESNQVIFFQNIRADDFRGRSLALSSWMKTEELHGAASIRLHFRDVHNNSLPEIPPDRRRLPATSDWLRREISGVVPTNAAVVMLMAIVQGEGRVWVDDFALTVDGRPVVPWSGGATNFYTRAPGNLDFEMQPVPPARGTADVAR